ncbi:hypothetical protein BCY91_09425 [Pelobium manganitolerans]|uniref:Uncharacterized protein n=1 Tax=Pelobium manganitolerans TaxID=1842495 RepID=A0A419S3A0_9SPHI|nr:hypothetical protein BCY91_09425 [Pelobium manganitolerans]
MFKKAGISNILDLLSSVYFWFKRFKVSKNRKSRKFLLADCQIFCAENRIIKKINSNLVFPKADKGFETWLFSR